MDHRRRSSSVPLSRRVTLIQRGRPWSILAARELWDYRELLWALVARDLRVRYKQTLLGASWAILQPVTQMLIFSALLGTVAKLPSHGVPYPIYVYAGLLPWTYFGNAVSSAASSVVSSSHIVSKVYFPRLLVPLASLGAALVDFAVSAIVLAVLMVWYRVPVHSSMLLVAPLLLSLVLMAAGMGAALASLNVKYRDFRYVVPFLLQLWMYVTPVLYAPEIVPDQYEWALTINPMAPLVQGFRAAILGQAQQLSGLLWGALSSLVVFAAGVTYFHSAEEQFTDLL
jgi:lipopolysaccharide transport system permease protein